MHLGEWDHIHGNFVHVYIKVAFEAHRTSQVVYDVGHYRILFLKMIRFLLYIGTFNNGRSILNSRLLVN